MMAQAQREQTGAVICPPQGTWVIDPVHSTIEFSVRHLMAAKVRGHFTRYSGRIDIADPPQRSTIVAEIDAATIDTRSPDRDEHLRSADFLDVAAHPTITYRSTAVSHLGGEHWQITGDLTMHGVTRPVTLEASYGGTVVDAFGTERFIAGARATLDREEFGLTWNQPLASGGLVVGKKIEVDIDLQAVRG
jgi:polyisoprenoid-binding protein YceI